ncbi:hypothetical protein [Pseudonocardia sp. GCM10023141]|uniref:hypothetical protein n=1 Tax=Pseudonocardia sp. GCM10023141 TaxID=3252653 RepID=UPI003609EAB4
MDPTITGCAVPAALDSPVPAVPAATAGVAWLRAHVARFSSGATHRRRRELVAALLADIDPAGLQQRAARDGGHPAAVLAAALGVPAAVADIRAVAACYQPHVRTTPTADAALARLVDACGGRWDEPTAARIGLLVQACDATATLVRTARERGVGAATVLRDDPPVRLTRRVGMLVDLASAGLPFGAGPHGCPGREHALALADALIGRTDA